MKTALLFGIALAGVSCSGTGIDQATEPPPEKLTLRFSPVSGPSFGMMLGSSLQISAQVVNAGGAVVAADEPPGFFSRNPNVLTADPNGAITAVSMGSTQLVADARVGTQYVRDSVEVVVVCTLELRLTVTPSQLILPVGGHFVPQVSLTTCGGQLPVEETFRWASTHPSVLLVEPGSGEMTALTPGTAAVTATGTRYNIVGRIEVAVQ